MADPLDIFAPAPAEGSFFSESDLQHKPKTDRSELQRLTAQKARPVPSLFDEDDDIFGPISSAKPAGQPAPQPKKAASLFDDDDDLFSPVAPAAATPTKQAAAAPKGLFAATDVSRLVRSPQTRRQTSDFLDMDF